MNNKRIPPAVGEFAVGERGKLLARIAEQAREIERLRLNIAEYNEHERCYQSELAALKARPSGVVQWPDADEIMQMAFEEGQPGDDASGYYFELEEFDLFIQRLMEEVARINSSTVSAGDENSEEGLEEWAKGKFGVGGRYTGKLYGNTDWALARVVWSAALSASSHGERGREWIPVSERLPEPWTDVLAYGVNHRSHSYVVAGVFSGTWASQETEEATRFEPTHWMPLPAAPSAGSQEQGE